MFPIPILQTGVPMSTLKVAHLAADLVVFDTQATHRSIRHVRLVSTKGVYGQTVERKASKQYQL